MYQHLILNHGGPVTLYHSTHHITCILCIYKRNGIWKFEEYNATTDCGSYWLSSPMRKSGSALLVPNQYRGVYKLDKHNGKYTLLHLHEAINSGYI